MGGYFIEVKRSGKSRSQRAGQIPVKLVFQKGRRCDDDNDDNDDTGISEWLLNQVFYSDILSTMQSTGTCGSALRRSILSQPTLLNRLVITNVSFSLEIHDDADPRRATCGMEMLVAAAFLRDNS